jgi:hypothetical protein
MDSIQKIATAVLKTETNFMQNTESSRTGLSGAKVKAENALKDVLIPSSSRSSDLTKFKLSSLTPDEQNFIGVHKQEDLEDPAKAGLASMLYLAKNYDYLARYAEMNPQLGLTKQDIEDLTALSYNQGMGKLYTIGSTEIDGKRYLSPDKIQMIRELANSSEIIDDITATKPGRIAEQFPVLSGIMKALYNAGVGGRNKSYMNRARSAMSNIKEK